MPNPTDTLEITVNGRPRELRGDRLPELLAELGVDAEQRAGVAVARNGAVIPRSAWAGTTLQDGDVLEVIGAVQGG